MGGQNNWTIDINANDYMRSMEKRVLHQDRRPQIRAASDLLGPGFGPYSMQTNDWNSEAACRQGFWWSTIGVINSPNNGIEWMGTVTVNAEGFGIQEVMEQTWYPPPQTFIRTFWVVGGIRNFAPWTEVGTGTGGGTPGPPGPKGDKGDTGPAGPKGSVWFTGSTTPTTGVPGDLWLKPDGHVWVMNSSGVWVDTTTDLSPPVQFAYDSMVV